MYQKLLAIKVAIFFYVQFVYVIPVSALSARCLQVSVWDANTLMNKQCLCVDTIQLLDHKVTLLLGNTVCDWFELSAVGQLTTIWHAN